MFTSTPYFRNTTELYTPVVFFFNDTATTEIYTLSLHDALPIWPLRAGPHPQGPLGAGPGRTPRLEPPGADQPPGRDRKSTRLNSSHSQISYAVFCLKKKNAERWVAHDHGVDDDDQLQPVIRAVQ